MVGIYKITNPKGKVYIGKSKNIEKRFKFYKNIENCKQQRKLYYSLLKYGYNNHKFEIIEECPTEHLNEKEIYWIKRMNCIYVGLNLTEGGDGGKLSKESEELRRINSMKSIIQYDLQGNLIKEHRGASEAARFLGKGNGNNINDCARGKYKTTYGFIWEYKNKQRTEGERKDFILSLKHRSNLGRVLSQETKEKISKSKKGKNYYTELGLKKLSESKKGNKFTRKRINIYKDGKLIINVETRNLAFIYVKNNYNLSYVKFRKCLQFKEYINGLKIEYA